MQTTGHLAGWRDSLRFVNKPALLVFVMCMALLAPHLGVPKGKVWDEHLYVSGAKALYHMDPGTWLGVTYTNPEHPPLGKYLIGLGVVSIGDTSAGWRAVPIVFGALTLVVIFLWISNIADSYTAWIAVVLVMTNGFWFVMSRLAMLSIFELFFCVAGFYFLSKDKAVWTGVCLGLACACRWNAVFAIALIVCWLTIRKHPEIKKAALVGFTSIGSYVVAFLPAVKFSLREFVRAQIYIFQFHRHPTGNVIAAQRWYLWPLRSEPEFYINSLFGNRVIIVLGAIAIIYLLAKPRYRLLGMAPLVFRVQWGITGRPFEFYYYFLDAMVFLSIAAALLLGEVRTRVKWFPVACVAVCVVWFMLHYPQFAYVHTPWDSISNYINF